MPSQSEVQRRKAIAKQLAQRAHAAAEAQMPISKANLAALFDHLGVVLVSGCDHTNRFTQAFLQQHGLSESAIVPWLGEYGGYCDCEVLANVEGSWGHS